MARLTASTSFIPILIDAVSILSSVISWRAALASEAAGRLEHQATRELIELAEREAELDRRVEQDVRLLPRYQEHVRAWRLARRTRDLGGTARARDELALARALRPFFLGVGQSIGFGDPGGNVEYAQPFVVEQLHRLDQTLNELRANASNARADSAERRARRLVAIVVIAVGSLLLLTIARFTDRAVRAAFALGGSVVALTSLALFAAIELTA